jgi:NAD(P)-dependent dehydrogenase (short-subunit alcohol dehydrogenase family)
LVVASGFRRRFALDVLVRRSARFVGGWLGKKEILRRVAPQDDGQRRVEGGEAVVVTIINMAGRREFEPAPFAAAKSAVQGWSFFFG